MSRSLALISTPIKGIPAGAFIRSYNVLPYLVKDLREYVDEVALYIPANSIKNLLETVHASKGINIDEASELLYREFRDSMKYANIDLTKELLEDMVFSVAMTLKKNLHSGRLGKFLEKKILYFGDIYVTRIKVLEDYFMNYFLKIVTSSYDETVAVYSMHENLEHIYAAYKFSLSLNSSTALMFHEPPYRTVKIKFNRELITHTASRRLNSRTRKFIVNLAMSKRLKTALGISPASFLGGDIFDIVKKYGVKIDFPIPANAIDKIMIKYRKIESKDKIAVYFGRLVPGKGAFELLHVWRLVESYQPDATLRIIGSFPSETHKQIFFNLIDKLDLKKVEFLGYIPSREDLWKIISEAKVLIYPSHQDAFSLTVLEALALGVSVVAYDIPAIRYVYKNIDPVITVNEGSIDNMAKKVIEILDLDDTSYKSMHNNEKTRAFLEQYSSWQKVAKSEFNILKKSLIDYQAY